MSNVPDSDPKQKEAQHMAQRDPFDTSVNFTAPAMSWKSMSVGDVIEGIVLPVPAGPNDGKAYSWEPQRGTGGLVKRFQPQDGQTEGDPMMNTVVWFLTPGTKWEGTSEDFRDKVTEADETPTDDGSRRWFVKGGKKSDHNQAMLEGVKNAGAKKLEIGQSIKLTLIKNDPRVVESGPNKGEKYRAPIVTCEVGKPTPENVAKARAWYDVQKAKQAEEGEGEGAFDAGAHQEEEPPF